MESSVFLSDLLTAHEPELHKSLQCRQATFRFMGRPLSFFACLGTMNYPLTRPSGILSPRRGRGMGGRGRFMERFPRKISRIEPLNLVGTARCAVRAAFSGATMPPAASRAGTSQRDVPTEVQFMGKGVRSGTCGHLALAAGCLPDGQNSFEPFIGSSLRLCRKSLTRQS